MRISRLISATNWRYAIGEVVLIVVGVTIALAGTSWYEGRQERRDEILVLQQLRQTLSEDLVEIESNWERTRIRERNIAALLEHLESEKPYTNDLGAKFRSMFGWRIVRITTAPFEALKIQGYKSISNEGLRERLILLYEDQYAKLEYNSFLDRDFAIEKIQPYFFENFIVKSNQSINDDGDMLEWVPKDYDKVREESYVANLCRHRITNLRDFALHDYEITTIAIDEILDVIDKELAVAN